MSTAVIKQTFFEIHTYARQESGYWKQTGKMPCGNFIEDAYVRLKKEIPQLGDCDLTNVKYVIKKIVKTEATAEEYTGSDFTAFMLKAD
jgi:hypothetical protein